MNHNPIPRHFLALSCAFLLAAGVEAGSGDGRDRARVSGAEALANLPAEPVMPLPALLIPALGEEAPRVHFDEPGDGALWARGQRWKMSFDAEGAVYYASFGPHRPGLELRFSPERVLLGGAPLAFERGANVERADQRVELQRGSFVEAYQLAPDTVEQLFVFHELPRRGELVLHLSVAGEHEPATRADGLEFRGAHGDVRYSRAVAIDASGRRVDALTELDAEGIVIRVDAEFMATAQLPLVIDPYIGQTWLDVTQEDTREPDVAWDSYYQVWVAVYQELFTLNDNDVRVRVVSMDGVLLQDGYADFTSAHWNKPRIGYVRFDARSLIVGEVGAIGSRIVRGRTVRLGGPGLELGTAFTISNTQSGEKFAPTVGGDPYHLQTSYFCVAFQREIPGSAVTHELQYALVHPASVIIIAPTPIPTGGGLRDSNPSLSRSNGTERWTLTFTRQDPATNSDIYATYVSWDGNLGATFGISAFGLARDAVPCASSPLYDTSWSAVTFERRSSIFAKPDVIVAAIHDGIVMDWINISLLENSGAQAVEQFAPSIDSDGWRFIVAYSEFAPDFLYDQLRLSELFLAGDKFGIRQPYSLVFPLGRSQSASKVAAAPINDAEPNNFMIVNHVRQNDQDYDVSAVRWSSTSGGTWDSHCYGDGSGTACPCGNSGAAAHGCANSVFATGALLEVSGVLSTWLDSAKLDASNLKPGQPCMFFQGTTALSGAVFGEGLRCVGGTVTRLAIKTASPSGSASFPAAGDPTLSLAGGIPLDGALSTYQVWYRDSAVFCNGSDYNLTNGVSTLWSQ